LRQISSLVWAVVLCSLPLALYPITARAGEPKPDQPIVGEGLIDRVIAGGDEPVFRADGYSFRVTPQTALHLSKRLTKLGDVTAGVWVRFEGHPDAAGTIIAAKAHFLKFRQSTHKPDPVAVQITMFPPDSKIDAYKGFATGEKEFPPDDEGGWCGWYPLVRDEALQEHVRQVGMSVVPQFERDLAENDSARIPFRFYVVDGTGEHKVMFCGKGLILLPMAALRRLHGDDELAAVLGEGVAGEMSAGVALLPSREVAFEGAAFAASEVLFGAAGGVAGGIAIAAVDARRMEHARSRMALALMTDAGYDPRQAAEAWRLLGPMDPPKHPEKVKDSDHSRYLRDFVAAHYSAATPGAEAPKAGEAPAITPDPAANR